MIKQVMPFVVGLFICSSLMAQVPQKINYQGIARNSYGAALANQSISIRLSVRETSANGTVVYQETRTVQTNQFGLFSTAIGGEGATAVSGTLGGVNWANSAAKFLEVEMDPKGGAQFVSLGISPLTSVPYAFRAESAAPVGTAGGDLSGSFPNPTIKDGAITAAKLAPGVIPTSIPVSGTAGGDLSGTYPNPTISANSVSTTKIADNAITSNKVADGAITAAKLAPGVIPTSLPMSGTAGGDLTGTYPNPTIAANAITNTKIADNSISNAKVQDNAISSGKLQDNAVTTTKVADASITAAKLAPGVIPTSLPMNGTAGGDLTGTYPNPNIAANAITNSKIADNSISNAKIQDNAISSGKLQDNAVTSAELNAAAVTTVKIADNAVTTAKVADASITAAKLAPGVIPTSLPMSGTAGGDLTGTYPNPTIAANAITTAKIADNAISSAKLQDNAVTSAELSAGAVTTAKIMDNNITTAKIVDGAITAAKLAPGVIPTSLPMSGTAGGDLTGTYPNPTIGANAITTVKVADGSITAAKLAPGVIPTSLPMSGTAGGDLTGTYPNPTVAANAVTSTKIADNAITTTKLNALSVTNAKIADNSITTTKVADASITAAKLAPGVIPTLFPPTGAAGGDLSGSYPNPVIGKLNAIPLSAVAPTSGQVLKFNGTQWAPGADNTGSGGLTFPFAASAASAGKMFALTNSGAGASIAGSNSAAGLGSVGVSGEITAASPSVTSAGVFGLANNTSPNGYGVWGLHNGSGTGVYGSSADGSGIAGKSVNGYGVSAISDNGFGLYASSTTSTAAFFDVSATGNSSDAVSISNIDGTGLTSFSNNGIGIMAYTAAIGQTAIWGQNLGDGEAVTGQNFSGTAAAIAGSNSGNYAGVRGESPDGIGVLAEANTNGGTSGTALVARLESAGTGNLAVFKVGLTNVARINSAGKAFFNGGTQNSGADVAEFFGVDGSLNSYEPGDVLEISTDTDRKVVKSSGPYSTLVAGVYATKPGLLLTEEDAVNSTMDNGVPMGVIGVIPTKVCMEGGAIKRGDMLVTSSVSGVAMKADPDRVRVGQVLGKALQDFNTSGIGKINVLVSVK